MILLKGIWSRSVSQKHRGSNSGTTWSLKTEIGGHPWRGWGAGQMLQIRRLSCPGKCHIRHSPVVTSITLLSPCWRTRSPTKGLGSHDPGAPRAQPLPKSSLPPLPSSRAPVLGRGRWQPGTPPQGQGRGRSPSCSARRPSPPPSAAAAARGGRRTPPPPPDFNDTPPDLVPPPPPSFAGIWGLCRCRRHPHPPSPPNPWGRPQWLSKGRRLRLRGRKTQDHRAGRRGARFHVGSHESFAEEERQRVLKGS